LRQRKFLISHGHVAAKLCLLAIAIFALFFVNVARWNAKIRASAIFAGKIASPTHDKSANTPAHQPIAFWHIGSGRSAWAAIRAPGRSDPSINGPEHAPIREQAGAITPPPSGRFSRLPRLIRTAIAPAARRGRPWRQAWHGCLLRRFGRFRSPKCDGRRVWSQAGAQ
jgi:hypothetical protein